MKTITMLFVLMLGQASWAQGLIFSQVSELPKVLELESRMYWDSKRDIRHVDQSQNAEVQVKFLQTSVMEQFKTFFYNKNEHLSCDGDYQFKYDEHNVQYIEVKSINVCLDKDGFVAAHSVGRPTLSPEGVVKISYKIQQNQQAKNDPLNIYQGDDLKMPQDSTRVEIPPVTIPY